MWLIEVELVNCNVHRLKQNGHVSKFSVNDSGTETVKSGKVSSCICKNLTNIQIATCKSLKTYCVI